MNLLKITAFFFLLLEELLSSEGSGMPKEEKLPEGSKNSPLNPENSLNLASGDHPISTQKTTVSRNFSPSVPGTSSSALVGRKSSTKSSHRKVKFRIQRKSEGNLKTVILNKCVCLSL